MSTTLKELIEKATPAYAKTLRLMLENVASREETAVALLHARCSPATMKLVLEALEGIAKQRPIKPDHWTPCGQCEDNIEICREALAALNGEEQP